MQPCGLPTPRARTRGAIRSRLLEVEDIWRSDRLAEAQAVFGTTEPAHPGVRALLEDRHPWYVGGRVHGLHLPTHHDHGDLRWTPRALRERFAADGWTRVVAFQTRNPLHRAHIELTTRAANEAGAHLLLHPVIGLTRPGDIDAYTRVRCYRAAMAEYPSGLVRLALLPIAMRMAGPREALWHAIVRHNYGCTHFIVGRDHAGPGRDAAGRPFYGPYDAQALVAQHADEIGIAMVPFREMVYVPDLDRYLPDDEVPAGREGLTISGSDLRARLLDGREIPAWFSPPAVVTELRRGYPGRARQGCTIFFTGLSGAGKSTVARILQARLLELGGRAVTLLDGDLVRKELSSELGFSREHRDLNIRRIGYVASEVTRHGGFAICAPIAPYDATRRHVRRLIETAGGFVMVHVATPLEVCEQRDHKGLYAKARAGILPAFTGISDPYEPPADAEIVVGRDGESAEAIADHIVAFLRQTGFLSGAVDIEE